jgi:hypothetical protein
MNLKDTENISAQNVYNCTRTVTAMINQVITTYEPGTTIATHVQVN